MYLEETIKTTDGHVLLVTYDRTTIQEVYHQGMDVTAEVVAVGDGDHEPDYQATFPDIVGCATLMFTRAMCGRDPKDRSWIVVQMVPRTVAQLRMPTLF